MSKWPGTLRFRQTQDVEMKGHGKVATHRPVAFRGGPTVIRGGRPGSES